MGGGIIDADRRRRIAAAALIVVATLVAYIPALRAGWIWDDDFYVTSNRNLRDMDGLARIWTDLRATPQYYPLTHTTFWVQHRLWGDWPFPYHLANVLLHVGSALLLWSILRRLRVPGAWLAAAIFALHPVEVESVAWVTERKNVLSGVFYFAAALVFLRPKLEERAGAAHGAWRARGACALSLLLFACALLGKTVTASLPVALALVLVWKRLRIRVRDGVTLGTMLLLGGAMGQLTSFLEKHQVGAMGPEWDFSFVERCLIVGRAWWHYLATLVWPVNLAFLYPRWKIDAADPAAWAWPVAAVVFLAALFAFRRRLGHGPLVAFAFFSFTVAPALGFFDVYPMRYSFAADHFQYLAGVGPIALLAALIATGAARFARADGARPAARKAMRAAPAAIVLAVLSVLTFRQCFAYRDVETLWRSTIARNEKAFMAHYNLAVILRDRGEIDAAEDHFRRCVAAKPDHYEALMDIGNILADRGDLEGAIEFYRRSLAANPDHALTSYNLALTLEQAGRPDEALELYRRTVQLDPGLGAAHNNLAILLYHRGAYREAAAELDLARRHGVDPNPDFVRALADKLEKSGDRSKTGISGTP